MLIWINSSIYCLHSVVYVCELWINKSKAVSVKHYAMKAYGGVDV
jgi:hypothetical protein